VPRRLRRPGSVSSPAPASRLSAPRLAASPQRDDMVAVGPASSGLLNIRSIGLAAAACLLLDERLERSTASPHSRAMRLR
jgi:hypothetical protein